VSFSQFHNRDFARAQHLKLPNSRLQHQFAQWRLSQHVVTRTDSTHAIIVSPPRLA
jgi:hypothetical protein